MKLNRVHVFAGSVGLAAGILLGGISVAVTAPQMAAQPPKQEVRWIHTTNTVTTATTVLSTSMVTSVQTLDTTVTVPTTEYVDVPSTRYVEAPTTVTVTQPAVASTAEEAPEAASWMEELRPQVDAQGLGVWVFEQHPETGAWGTTDGYTVWIDPQVPQYAQRSVMIHEYAHILQRIHYGSLDQTQKQTGNMESLADCMAQQMGATVLSYGCDQTLVPLAREILGG